MSISQNELRKYEGNGKLHFSTGENIDCKFEIQCHDDGRSNVTCCVPVSRDFIKILERRQITRTIIFQKPLLLAKQVTVVILSSKNLVWTKPPSILQVGD